jgi:ABC-type oligopeptide transport system substrate-binding subunit
MKLYFGSQYHCPVNYFLNLDVREAFAYAFNYNYFLDEILGNKRYGVQYGTAYAGAIMPGLPDYIPASELQNVPYYNLTYAKQLLQESGEYTTAINIPWPIYPCYACGGMDNQTKFAMVQMYAADLHSIDPNIVITPILDNGTAPGDAYMIGRWGWAMDYPYPSDVVDWEYQDPYAPAWLNSTGHPDQAAMYAQMNALIAEADSTTNETLAAQDYRQIEQIAINLYLYVYTFQPNRLLVMKPYMNGYQGQVSYIMNPLLGSAETAPYVWLVKTCGSTQACSGRGVGP